MSTQITDSEIESAKDRMRSDYAHETAREAMIGVLIFGGIILGSVAFVTVAALAIALFLGWTL